MSSGLFSPIPDDRSNPALGLPPSPRDTLLHLTAPDSYLQAPADDESPLVTIYEAPILEDTATDALPMYAPGDQLAETILNGEKKIRFEAYTGPQAGGHEHARQGPGGSYHFHLYQNNEPGPRISSETFRPLTPEDEKLLKGDYKKVIDNLTDAEKRYLSKATREIFHGSKRIPLRLIEQLGRSRMAVPFALRGGDQ